LKPATAMSKKALLSFIISFLLFLTVIIIDRISFEKMRTYTRQVNQARQVMTALEQLSNHFKSAQIYSEKFAPVAEHTFYKLYNDEGLMVRKELGVIKNLVSDNPVQKKRLDTINSLIEMQLDSVMKYNIVELIHSGQGWRLKYLFTIHNIINEALAHEELLLQKRTTELNQFTKLNSWLSILFSVIAVAIIIVAFFGNLSANTKWDCFV
jgi:CHASE3 domain sensor protein